MKRVKLLQHLQAHGCEFHREGAAHSIWINRTTNKREAIPRHTEIKAGLVRQICKRLSVPPPTEK